MTELTPAQKRKITMRQRYGENWAKDINGTQAKEAREAKHGVEQYSKAGKQGGSKSRPASRPFKKNRKLAAEAGRKGGSSPRKVASNDTTKND